MTSKIVLKKLKQEVSTLRSEHGVSALYIFGSFARGTSSSVSDIDILVEFSKPVGLFDFVRLKNHLEEILNRKVDLVTRDALSKSVAGNIEREAIRAA